MMRSAIAIMSQTQQPPVALERGDSRIHVLVTDRNAHYRETLRRVLERYPECAVVGEAATLTEAVAIARAKGPDLVLLDFDVVAREKVGRVRKIEEEFPHVQVVVLLSDYSQDYREAVQVRWGYLCVAKDRVEEHLAWIISDVKPTIV